MNIILVFLREQGHCVYKNVCPLVDALVAVYDDKLVKERTDSRKPLPVNLFISFAAVVRVNIVDCQKELGFLRKETQVFNKNPFNGRNLDKRQPLKIQYVRLFQGDMCNKAEVIQCDS
jgi:hypothetical protein